MGFSNNAVYRGACIVFHNVFFLVTNKSKLLFNENSLEFRGVMPECIFVLLGPWNRYRCFLKDERNAMGTLTQGWKPTKNA